LNAPRARGNRHPRDKPSREDCVWLAMRLRGGNPNRGKAPVPIRIKKLIGTILLIILVIVYAVLATLIAVAQLSESGPIVHLLYFFLTGLLWIVPAMFIIKWMIGKPEDQG
jgi:hypothetical protein